MTDNQTTAIKLWVLRSIDLGTTFETVDTATDRPNIEIRFDRQSGQPLAMLFHPEPYALPPGAFRVLTEIHNGQ